MHTYNVIIIDDQKEVLSLLAMILQREESFTVDTFVSGLEGMNKIKRGNYDLAIIDLNLENISGKTIIEEIRRDGLTLPIIVLTATDSSSVTVDCLNAGADDYVVKPFDAKVLVARVTTLLRRSGAMDNTNSVLLHDQIELNKEAVKVTRDGKPVELTAKEFQLLQYLMENKGKVISRSNLMNKVWGYDNLAQARVVDVHISNLRKKINQGFNQELSLVETVRGFGYRVL